MTTLCLHLQSTSSPLALNLHREALPDFLSSRYFTNYLDAFRVQMRISVLKYSQRLLLLTESQMMRLQMIRLDCGGISIHRRSGRLPAIFVRTVMTSSMLEQVIRPFESLVAFFAAVRGEASLEGSGPIRRRLAGSSGPEKNSHACASDVCSRISE